MGITNSRTPQPWHVKPAKDVDANGKSIERGWHLMEGDEWRRTYTWRWMAQREADRQNTDLVRMAAQWGNGQ